MTTFQFASLLLTIISLVGGTAWLLSWQIGTLRSDLAAHTAEEKGRDMLLQSHKERLDDHESRLRSVELGECLVELANAVKAVRTKDQ